jgi:hypothetical protein
MHKKLISISSLVWTWLLLFFIVRVYAEWAFAPWEAAVVLPSIGTWQRTLNDFFDIGTGSYLVAAITVLLSMMLVLNSQRQRHYPYLIVANLGLLISLPLALFGSAYINRYLFPVGQITYGTAVLPFIAYLVLTGLWLFTQKVILHSQGKIKRAISANRRDFTRLEDEETANLPLTIASLEAHHSRLSSDS